jgi:hypothetical protein
MNNTERKHLRYSILLALIIVVGALIGSFIRPSGIYEAPAEPATRTAPVEHLMMKGVAEPGPETSDINYPGMPYWFALVPTGRICFEVRGSTYATQAALNIYYGTDAKIIPARSNCNGYPSTNHIRLRGADLGKGVCAITTGVAGTSMVETIVRGVKVWVFQAPEIRYNTNPAVTSGCFGSSFAARHVYGHELLHAIGMKHNWGVPSLVASSPPSDSGLTDYSWDYMSVTSWDVAEINRRY